MNLAALGSPGYRRYFLGNVFALNGMWLSRVTIAWLAWDMTGRASFVGVVAFLVFAPTLVSGPFFGVVADRMALKKAAMLSQSGLAASALPLLVAAHGGVLDPALLAALALVTGIVTSAHHPIRLALVPALVERPAIGSAVALASVNFNLARLTGPAIGGPIIAGYGIGWALALAVACFLPTIALLPGIQTRPVALEPRRNGVLASLWEGIGYAARTPLVRRAMVVIGVFSLVGRGLLEILPVLADGVFQRGPAGLGALTAAAGAGALVAAATITLGPAQRPGRLPLASRIAAVAGLAVVAALAWTPSWPLALALTALLGLCGTFVGVGMQSAVQIVLADAYRGRVMSLWIMLAVGGSALGAVALGALIDLVGPRPALTATAAAGIAVLALALARPLAPPAAAPTFPGKMRDSRIGPRAPASDRVRQP